MRQPGCVCVTCEFEQSVISVCRGDRFRTDAPLLHYPFSRRFALNVEEHVGDARCLEEDVP